ncbi:MAG: DUF4982 domain-containing protein [Anaerolineaceae bacterium]|nr:DUF4982 domain-containing protein [Anaerolineaceae bacterium]
MKKINFNDNWQYGHLDQNDKTAISIPHDAMFLEKRTADSVGDFNISWFEGLDYWYEKSFQAVDEFFTNNVIVEFEGVYQNAEVFLNEQLIANRPYGYSNFYADMTGKIKEGTNVLRVIVKNSMQPNSRWYTGSGIYRPVHLYLLPQEHIELNGIQIKTLDHTRGEIGIRIKTNYPGEAKIEIFDGESVILSLKEKLAGDSKIVCDVPEAKLWSTEFAHLYKCKVTFLDDEQSVEFGIRSIQYDAKSGFCINGERVILRGACIHHDNGLLGACAYDFAEERKVKILKEAGYNAIRSAHNPCSKALLKACDEQGMLVVDEFVDCWYIHKTKYDYVNYFEDWWQIDLNDMVEKDFNHPSVIMYSIGNEVSETAQKRGIELTGQMTEYLHSLDDSRPVTCGINVFFNYLSSLGFGVYTDEKAEQAFINAEKGGNKKNAVGSEFFNRLAGKLGDKTMKLGATLRGSDLKTKDAFANLDISGYNYGILRYKKDLKKYPERLILGSETFCKDASKFMKLAQQYPAIIGDFVWAGMDYLGEAGIGAHEYKDYAKDFSIGVGWISSGSGRIDLTGKQLAEAAYTRVAFGVDPIHVAVVPVDNFKNQHSPSAWKMTNARESWSWNGCDGMMTKVDVYANAYKIELYVNDKLVGTKKNVKNCRAYFKTKYYSGEIKAIAYDKKGNKKASTILKTAEENTVLGIYPESHEIKKEDLAYVRFKYTDKFGILKPLTKGRIDLKVSGGKLLGFGHACPYNEVGYLNDFSDTYYGEALAIIKPESDRIILQATSPFGEGNVEIKVVD